MSGPLLDRIAIFVEVPRVEYEKLLAEAPRHLRPGGVLLVEIGWDEGERLREMAAKCSPAAQVEVKKGPAGLNRLFTVQAS